MPPPNLRIDVDERSSPIDLHVSSEEVVPLLKRRLLSRSIVLSFWLDEVEPSTTVQDEKSISHKRDDVAPSSSYATFIDPARDEGGQRR